MKLNVIGYEKVDFTNDQGQKICGFNLYFTEPVNAYGQGVKGNKKFVASTVCTSASVGVADVEVSLSGKISAISWSK